MSRIASARWTVALVAAFAVIALGPGQASATSTYTSIGSSVSVDEHDHEQILENLYGGDFVASGHDFSNGWVSAIRVPDNLDQIIELPSLLSARTAAVFGSPQQSFGYIPGDSGPTGEYIKLFDVGVGVDSYDVSGAVSDVALNAGDFRWARVGGTGLASSRDGDNIDELDHIVTYQIVSLPQIRSLQDNFQQDTFTQLLFFEGLFGDARDDDFNDLVVEVTSVPTPAALGPGLALLGLAGIVRRRRRRRA